MSFFDASGTIACVRIPSGAAGAKPPGWKVKTTPSGTTWSFRDDKNGQAGDPTKDKMSVQCNTKKDTCTVKLNVKEANIAGDTSARNITTGVVIGNDGWRNEQAWQPKAKGKKIVTP